MVRRQTDLGGPGVSSQHYGARLSLSMKVRLPGLLGGDR